MTSLRLPTSAGLLLAVCLAAPAAMADQKSDLYAQGVAAYNSGDSILARQKFCQLAALDGSYKPDDKSQPDANAQCTEAKAAEQRTLNRYRNNFGEGVTLMGDGKLDEAAAKFRLVKAGDYADQAKAKLVEIARLKQLQVDAAQQSQAAEQANSKKLEQGTNAFLAGRMDEAKSTLGGVTGSHQADAQVVLTKIRNYEAAVAKGKIFDNAKDFTAAKNAYAEAVSINAAGPATDLLTKAAAAASAPTPNNASSNPPPIVKPPVVKPQIDVAAYLRDGQKAMDKGDFKKAKRFFQEVLAQDVKNDDANAAMKLIQARDTSKAEATDADPQLSRYISAFYSGDYATAEQLLSAYIYSQTPGKGKVGLANFYLGASLLTRYYLGGANNATLKQQAIEKFKLAKGVDGFKAPDKFVSPKIMKVFDEAS